MHLSFSPRGRVQHLSAVLVIVVIFFAGFALGNQYAIGRAQGSVNPPPEAAAAFEPFWQVFNLIQSDYLDTIDINTLVDGATNGLMNTLNDPYSGYMNPELYDLMNDDMSGEFNGIGVVIHTNQETGEIEVVGLIEGAPAQLAGVRHGDILSAVDDRSVTGMSQTELAVLVRGAEGTQVKVTMRRDGELIEFDITRAHITVPNVETEIVGDIAYIKLNQFTANARAELDAALETVDVNTRQGLILDLRDNPGGYLSSAIDVASAFVPSGIVVTEDFGDTQQNFDATGKVADIQVPIAVLVNGGSASASELLAGALQDHNLATIIGETTLGKGTVQTWHELVNGGGVRLTIARWLTPKGHWIHEQGITPGIAVAWENPTYAPDEDDPQIDAAVDYLESLTAEAAAA